MLKNFEKKKNFNIKLKIYINLIFEKIYHLWSVFCFYFEYLCGKFQISEYYGLIATLHTEIRKFYHRHVIDINITLEIIPKFYLHFTASTEQFLIKYIIYKFTNKYIDKATGLKHKYWRALLSAHLNIINNLIAREHFSSIK